jgi:SpoIID/LytB domain protein
MTRKPQIFVQIVFAFLLGIYSLFLISRPAYSDEASDLQNQIDQKNQELTQTQTTLSQVEAKIAEISNSNYSVNQKIALIDQEIDSLNSNIDQTAAQIAEKEKEIADKQAALDQKRTEIDQLSSQLYMQSQFRLSTFFLSSDNWSDMVKDFFVKANTISLLKNDMEKINGEFNNLSDSKTSLDQEKSDLDSQKQDLDKASDLLAQEKATLQAQLNDQYSSKNNLTAQIGSLTKDISQLQQFLLAAKSGGTVIDANSVPNNPNSLSSQSYFRNNAPAGSFEVFAFGAYTNRAGMSQWGAKARSDAGQTYQQILNAYYPGKVITTTGTVVNNGGVSQPIMTQISTTSYGTLNFEDDYILRLNEMPESWSMAALEAQAIIARTYAINYTNNGSGTICTTEACQVIGDGQKTGAWAQAVAATRGMVLTDSSGKVFSAQYAAVNGGVESFGGNLLWDTITSKGDYANWTADAYESISGVNWFYKTWFTKGYSDSGASCGHSPWLSNAEMSDLLNAYLLWISNGKSQSDPRIVSVDVASCWGQSANPYSMSDLKSFVSNPVTQVYSAITTNSNGTTTNIAFNTNRGVVSMSGADFKAIYNMRAPSALSIPQSNFININVEYK